MKIKQSLESTTVTAQQEEGLKAFRDQQEEGFQNEDEFIYFYKMWQRENGYFDDSRFLGKMNTDEVEELYNNALEGKS